MLDTTGWGPSEPKTIRQILMYANEQEGGMPGH